MNNKYKRKGTVCSGPRKSPLSGKSNLPPQPAEGLLSFNFKYLAPNQGQTIADWSKTGLLLAMVERIRALSSQTVTEACAAQGSAFAIYDTFPEKSAFTHPKHVPLDAVWARFHVKGKEVVAGHLDGSVFYIVFLDKDHQFYKTEKKHT